MKKIAAMLIILILSLSACTKKPPAAPIVPQEFRAVLSVTSNDLTLKCEWEQPQPGNAVFRVIAPKSLAGLTLTFTGSDCRANLGDLTTDIKMPLKSFFIELMETLEIREDLTITEKDGITETIGKIKTGAFAIKQNAHGDYQSFELPHGTAEVLDFSTT